MIEVKRGEAVATVYLWGELDRTYPAPDPGHELIGAGSWVAVLAVDGKVFGVVDEWGHWSWHPADRVKIMGKLRPDWEPRHLGERNW